MQIEEIVLVGVGIAAAAYLAHSFGAQKGRREAAATRGEPEAQPTAKETPAPKAEAPASKEDAPASKAKAPAPKDAAGKVDGVIAQIEYEEDEDIDPTKVGVGAGATSKRLRLEPSVQKIVYDEDAETDEPSRSQSLFLVSATAQTDRGLRRKRNEDSVLVKESEHLYVVADGMGGYKGGHLASSLAVETIGETFGKSSQFGPPRDDLPKDATALARAIQLANDKILDTATKKNLKGMGTTVCAARFSPNKKRVYIGHVGDSRCYRLRDGALKQITADHTMRDFGVTGPESAQLSRAVGIWPAVPIDIIMAEPQAGDVYLLCSDGLTKMVPDDVIGSVLSSEEDPTKAVERLIFFANARGGKDNISVILVRVVPPAWSPRPSTLDEAELARKAEEAGPAESGPDSYREEAAPVSGEPAPESGAKKS